MPKGGGAIKPVGEKFEAIAFTGAASFTVAIATSSGRGGAGPQLALSYSSGAGNGPFGTGWTLGNPSIARKTESELPQYADERESDTFLLAGAEDLVPLRDAGGDRVVWARGEHRVYLYRPRVEGLFARIERWVRQADGDTHWRVITKGNTTSWYGQSAQARIADPEDPLRVFSWLVEQTSDDRGNVIRYEYKPDDASRYLKRILYGNRVPFETGGWLFEVVFDYGEHGQTPAEDGAWLARNDAFSSFRSGFEVRTSRLCRRVLMFHHFEASTLVRSTDLEYDELPHLAKLVRVVQRSYEPHPGGGHVSAAMPPIEMVYTEARIQPDLNEIDPSNLPYGIDGSRYRLIDLDGEGLPGVATQIGENLHYQSPRGAGRFGALRTLPTQTTSTRPGTGAQLVDLDGDGRPELVGADGFYSRAENGDWASYTSFAQVTTLDPGHPNVRQIDLDASGLPDLLVSHDDHFVWVPSLGTQGYGPARLIQKPSDERTGPAIVFNDPSGTLFLADMTGDGLQDIVRIHSGAVHYWPNLGRGRFGRRVTMADAPVYPDFDPRGIRLADIDGSGTTDIVYLNDRGARAWFNLSGNGFSAEMPIRPFPGVSDTTSVEVTDLLGKGTACLMWSQPGHVQYLDLMGDKPHLLVSVVNNMGLETRVQYEPSTFQYLRDRDAGRPWLTRLPFPVYVATRIERYDAVARRRFVQRSSYHHGYFDAVEREFRGFARVDRWDTESFEDFNSDGLFSLELFDSVEEDLHQPPVHTRSWFHTGAFFGASRISRQLENEYWAGDSQAWLLPDTVLPLELSPDESREAVRALRGRLLRSEVYALDGIDVPYTVAEANFTVRLLQAQGPGKHAVFLAHDREALSYHYERAVSDPRITHGFTLEVDDHGNVTRQSTVSYPRRAVTPGLEEQGQHGVVYAESSFTAVDQPDAYRASVPVSGRTHEVSGLEDALPWRLDTLLAALPNAGLRLLTADRTFYYADDLSGPLPLGSCGTRALVFEVHGAAFSDSQRDSVFGADAPDELLLGEGGYVHDEQLWWARSPHQELDPARFYAPVRVFDQFGNPPAVIEYDEPNLFVVRVTDPIGNVVNAEIDYRVLVASLVTDPNGTRNGVTFDPRGMVIATFVMGRPGSGLGDSAADPTTTLDYDLFAWQERGEPNFVHARARETHADPQTRWIEKYTYSDGSGNVLLEKVTAEPDGAPRWVGTGRTFLDNKGNPVKQYEPYFSPAPAYEAEAEFREQGVTPILHYDPLGRLVRTDLPSGTFSRVEFTPWAKRDFDANDTVLDSDWFAARAGGALGPQEQRAASVTQPHANTPTTTHLDHLGRAFLIFEDPGAEPHATRFVLDVQGNVLEVVDARGNSAETRVYGMRKQPLASSCVDTGWRRSLLDTAGTQLREWNERGFTSRMVYDVLRRPTHRYVTPPGQPETLVIRTVWGEEAGLDDLNLRTQVYRVIDDAGEAVSEEYDFKGNLLRQSRLIADETFTVTTEYDAFSKAISQTAPDGSVTLLSYNEAGLLESVGVRLRGAALATTFVSDVDYDARGQRELCTHGNGTSTSYEYDPLTFRLTRLRLTRASDSSLLQDLRYTYDPVGNITEIRDGAQQVVFFAGSVVTPDQQFEYDPRYRLTVATGREHAALGQSTHADVSFGPLRQVGDSAAMRRYQESYIWDEVGNLLALQHSANGGSFTRRYEYSAQGNRLLATSAPGEAVPPFTHSYTYDVHGNMTSMPHLAAIDWDHADRLRHADLGGGGEVSFSYDSAGVRVRKTWVNLPGGVTRERLYLGSWEIWRERSNGALRQERQTLHIGDDTGRVCAVETRTIEDGMAVSEPVSRQRFQHGNHLGSAALELDDQAGIISYEEYHPFGTTSYAAANSAVEVGVKRYRYIGKERDEETGLHHCNARYYASWLGRWTAPDPIGLSDGMNRYAYARGNPATLADPGGRRTQNRQEVARRVQQEVNAEVEAGTIKESDAVGVVTKRLEEALGDQTPVKRPKRPPAGYTGYSPDTSGNERFEKQRKQSQAKQAAQYDANKKVAEAVKNRDGGPAGMVAQETVAAFPVVGWAVDAMELHAAYENYQRSPGILSGVGVALSASAFLLPLAGGISRGLRHTGDVIDEAPIGAATHQVDDASTTAAPSGSTVTSGPVDGGAVAEPAQIRAHQDQIDPDTGRRPAGHQSHHPEQQAALKRNIHDYNPDHDPTLLMQTPQHQATFKAQGQQRARGAQFEKELGSAGAIEEAAQIMQQTGVSPGTAGQAALEHVGYMFGLTGLGEVAAALLRN